MEKLLANTSQVLERLDEDPIRSKTIAGESYETPDQNSKLWIFSTLNPGFFFLVYAKSSHGIKISSVNMV